MPKGRSEEGPEPIDLHLGGLVRQHRVVQGLSQVALSKKVDVTYQQIQKYETGENRINAPMLWKLSLALKVPIGSFFRGLALEDPPDSPVLNRDALEVLRAYQAIPDREARRSVKVLLRQMAKIAAGSHLIEDPQEVGEVPDQPEDPTDTE